MAVRTRIFAALATALCATALAAPAAAQSGRSNAGPVQTFTCGELAGRNIAAAAILSCQVVAATATVAEHCRVRGLIDPKLNFELRLPSPAVWNGKLHYGGGGGYNGSIPGVNANALNKGFAQVSSDSGHQGSALDASFVLGDPQAAALRPRVWQLSGSATGGSGSKRLVGERKLAGIEPSTPAFRR